MASLALSLLSAPDARAGSYNVTYTGGTVSVTGTGGANGTTYPFSQGEGMYAASESAGTGSYSNPTAASYSIKINGSITATFAWVHGSGQTDANDPPPAAALVEQDCTASWTATGGGSGTTGSGSSNSGLPGAATASTLPSGSSATTNYAAGVGGASFSVSCSPSASSSGSIGLVSFASASGTAQVVYHAAASPVTINVGGTMLVNGVQDALTGLPLTATLQGIPSGFIVTKYTWAVGGSAFETYNQNAPSNQLVPLGSMDLTGPAKGSSTVAPLAFYDSAAENLTITCAVTVTAPDGSILNLTATAPPINVLKPTASWGITGGIVRVNNALGTIGLLGLPGDLTYTDGQSWHDVAITVPAPFSSGQFCFAQLIRPDRKYYRTLPPNSTAPAFYQILNNGTQGLDSAFPYMHQWTIPTQPTNTVLDADSPQTLIPGIGGTITVKDSGGSNWSSIVTSDKFETWLMYRPSATGSVWVPLKSYTWSWSGNEQYTVPDPTQSGGWSFVSGTPSTRLTYTANDENNPLTWMIAHSNSDPIGPPPQH